MPNRLSRIKLRYPAVERQGDDEYSRFGLFDLEVSEQGQRFRPANSATGHVFDARQHLQDTGWTCVEIDNKSNGNPTLHPRTVTETWHRLAAPRPGDDQW